MDFQRIRALLPPPLRETQNLEDQYRRYCEGGGAVADADAFLQWLNQQPQSPLDPYRTMGTSQVELSQILPSRFARDVEPTQHVETADPDAPTMLAARSYPAVPPPPRPLPVGAPADFHYIVLGTAGKGGMGTVHIAKDTELLRRVALKQLNPEADAQAGARARFMREVQITAQLDHPNIVPVYTLELAPGGTPAYTMKFVEGKTFHTLLNEARDFFDSGKWPDETRSIAARLEHFLKVCDAIAYAHDKGVIHRDLKPANLMLGRHNEVYVMDWGLCRVLRQPDETPPDRSMVMASPEISGSASETQIGDVVGTPKYMSPEQAQGRNRDLDARSDQCALGLILYEMVTLNPPYDGRTAYEVLVNAAAGKRRTIVHAYLGRRIPRELSAIVERATALSPDQRYMDVAQMAADIRRFLRGEEVLAHPDNLWQRIQRWIGRHKQVAAAGTLATIALAAIGFGALLWQSKQALETAHRREQQLLQLRNAVADASDHVQMRFVQLEGAIVNLADSVEQVADYARPGENRFYMLREFRDAASAPPDLRPSAALRGKISLRFPVWTIPPGMSEEEALPTIKKLSRLQPFRREIYQRVASMIKSKNGDLYGDDPTASDGDNNPLSAIMVAFTSGIASRYPGWDGLPDGYDPREHPWYQLAAGKFGPQWGAPYMSSVSGAMELPLSVPIYDNHKRLLGVVSALLLPDLMVGSVLDMRKTPGVRGVFLLDNEARILASVGHAVRRREEAPDEAVTQVFPLPALVWRVKAGKSGILETNKLGGNDVICYDTVNPLGWSVVAIADAKQLLSAPVTEDTSTSQ